MKNERDYNDYLADENRKMMIEKIRQKELANNYMAKVNET